MSRTAFEKLRDMLGDMIIVQAHRCPVPEALYPEIIMAIGLGYPSGDKCLDLKNVYNVSLPSVYRICDPFINAVNSCPELIKGSKLPETVGEMAAIAAAFECLGTSGLIRGYVGCIDGFLAATARPKMGDSNNNPNAYDSGHYGMYGLNVQAVYDNQFRFPFFGVVATGKCGDQVAFECTILNDYLLGRDCSSEFRLQTEQCDSSALECSLDSSTKHKMRRKFRNLLEVPEFRLFYVSCTFHADYIPEICSTNSKIIPRFLNDRMSSGDAPKTNRALFWKFCSHSSL